MPEFLRLLPPDEARSLLLSHIDVSHAGEELVETAAALGRVVAEDVHALQPLPDFRRSTVDGYALQAKDTFGSTESQPGYLRLAGEVPMGVSPDFKIDTGYCALIHTGGMLPDGADAVVMLEHTQPVRSEKGSVAEIEIYKAVSEGENVIQVGEDVRAGMVVLSKGCRLRPADIGGLMALGITRLRVAKRVKVGIISSGDEVVDPSAKLRPGQVRDVNAYTLSALVRESGGEAVLYGIVADSKPELTEMAKRALTECEIVLITAGSSASVSDLTAGVIDELGSPGVLVHGINTRPGKPTILGVCDGKAVIGLPGNPVSALVNGYLFVVPVIGKLMGLPSDKPRGSVFARLTVNLPSQAGREDWWPVKLVRSTSGEVIPAEPGMEPQGEEIIWNADPIFGKSNLIFTLSSSDGLIRIPPDATGLSAGAIVEVVLF